MSTDHFNQMIAKARNRVGAVALAMVAIALPACTTPDDTTATAPMDADTTAQAPASDNVTTEELTGNLENYVGQTVSIREEIDEVVGDYAFSLEDSEFFGGEDILVINASDSGIELVDGDDTDVQVTGEVREFILADVEDEFGFDLDPDLYVDYEQQPVIIAQSIALSPDPADITEEPEQYYDRRIALSGEIEEIWDENTFTIDDESLFGGDDLLVFNPQAGMPVREDSEVVATGTLRPFIAAEFERDYDLTWDLDLQQEIEAEYENKPVFVVDEVYPVEMDDL